MAADVEHLLGIPWAADGRHPARGLSCYGLLLEVYRIAGATAPSLWLPAADGSEQPQFAADVLASFATHWDALPGPAPMACLSLPCPWFDGGGHCAVLLGDDTVIHAMPTTGVIRQPLARIAGKVCGYYRLREPAPMRVTPSAQALAHAWPEPRR